MEYNPLITNLREICVIYAYMLDGETQDPSVSTGQGNLPAPVDNMRVQTIWQLNNNNQLTQPPPVILMYLQ